MIHLPHFDALKRDLGLQTVRGKARISTSYNDFLAILRLFLGAVPVDEDWSLTTYEDVRKAVSSGQVTSARDQFVHDGYFEGRLPAPIEANEEWYLKHYPDVQEGIRRSEFESAQKHFVSNGDREGRRPFHDPANRWAMYLAELIEFARQARGEVTADSETRFLNSPAEPGLRDAATIGALAMICPAAVVPGSLLRARRS